MISNKINGDKIYQIVKDNNIIYAVGKKNVYQIKNNEINKEKKINILKADFVKGVPHGSFLIEFKDGCKWNPKNIIEGRVFDFIQSVHPEQINMAGYDNTIRGEFPQLLDPDHAVEIDKLRRYMQEGKISHYVYDDYNPVYPKAGK